MRVPCAYFENTEFNRFLKRVEAISDRATSGGFVDVSRIVAVLDKIVSIEFKENMNALASVISAGSQHKINFSKIRTDDDRRFVIAHEIGHILFDEFVKERPFERSVLSYEGVESIVNLIADHLLIPSSVAKDIIAAKQLDSDVDREYIARSVRKLRVPYTSLARRVCVLNYPKPMIFVYCKIPRQLTLLHDRIKTSLRPGTKRETTYVVSSIVLDDHLLFREPTPASLLKGEQRTSNPYPWFGERFEQALRCGLYRGGYLDVDDEQAQRRIFMLFE